MRVELPARRAYNKKVFSLGTLDARGLPQYEALINAGHWHYKGQDGVFKDKDVQFVDMGTYWQMVKHSYRLFVQKEFGAEYLIKYDNRYKGSNHDLYYEPAMLAWVDKQNLSNMVVFREAQPVTGELLHDKRVRYANAFGDGIHFEVRLQGFGFKKEVVIDGFDKIEAAPGPEYKLVLFNKFIPGTKKLKIKTKDNEEWDDDTYFEDEGGFKIEEALDKKSLIKEAYIIGSSTEEPEAQRIKIFWTKYQGDKYQCKILPIDFLQNATYPVRADTTTDFDAGSGDGHMYNYNSSSGLTWTNLRTPNSGTKGAQHNTANSDGVIGFVMYRQQTNDATYARMFCRGSFPFDASSIDDGATVTAASVFIYGSNAATNDMGFDATDRVIHLQSHSRASTSTLTANDYNVSNFGSTSFGSFDIGSDGSSWDTAGYNEFVLNASGIANVSLTAVCVFGAMIGADFLDNDPGFYVPGGNYANTHGSAIYTDNGSNEPYLSVTYTSGTAHAKSLSESAMSISDALSKGGGKYLKSTLTPSDAMAQGTGKGLSDSMEITEPIS